MLEEPLKFKYETRPAPTAENDFDVIVQVKATGICGSDVHFWTHGRIYDLIVDSPVVLGHESAGIVTAVGPRVKNVQVGDRVCIEPGRPCYRCNDCLSGQYNHCQNMVFAAVCPVDGTLCKYFKVDSPFVYKLPESVSLEEGAVAEPISVAAHACRLSGATHNSTCLVLGAGPVGYLIAALLKKAYGATNVVLVDVNEERLRFSREHLGVATYLSVKGKSAADVAKELVAQAGLEDERGFSVSFDATGVEFCGQVALNALRSRGTFMQVGMGADMISVPISVICMREIKVIGCFRYNQGDFKESVKLLADGILDVKPLITSKYAFSEAEAAFEASRRGIGMKTVIYGPE